MVRRCLLLVVAPSVLLAGCGGDKQPAAENSSAATPAATSGANGPKLDKLVKEDVKKGDGPVEVKPHDIVYVWYVGKLANGSVFDSKEMPENPVAFSLDQVIKGWGDGMVGMRAGGERKLSIPATLGYGSQSQGEKLPANSDLYFDIKLAYVVEPGKENVFDFTDTKVGTGPAAKVGSKVKILFSAYLLTGVKAIDNVDPAKAKSFTIGQGKVLAGLERGVIGMKKGGKRTIMLPPAAAFGEMGQPPAIPPDSPIRFEVEMLDVK